MVFVKYVCGPCGYVYDPEQGDSSSHIKSGTAFEKLPGDWVCPHCGALKTEFYPLVGHTSRVVDDPSDDSFEQDNSSQGDAVLVTEEMTVGDVIKKYPAAVHVLNGYGFHCVGCSSNAYEPLGTGARGHGMDDDGVKELLVELNTVAHKQQQVSTIQLTPHAAQQVLALMKDEQKNTSFLRVKAVNMGCSGVQHDLALEDTKSPADNVFESHGVTLLVDEESLGYLHGVVIDYVENGEQSGFKFSFSS